MRCERSVISDSVITVLVTVRWHSLLGLALGCGTGSRSRSRKVTVTGSSSALARFGSVWFRRATCATKKSCMHEVLNKIYL